MMNRKLFSAACALAGTMVLLTSCSLSDYSRIPDDTGFFRHMQKNPYPVMHLEDYWDNLDAAEWNNRVHAVAGKMQHIHIKPVTLDYFTPRPANAAHAAAVEHLRDYFQEQLDKRMKELNSEPGNTLVLENAPGKGVYTVEVALLSAKPARVLKNAVMQIPGMLITGGTLAAEAAAGNKEDMGYVSFGARVYDDHGKLICELGDFEYGMQSVLGHVGLDTKDYRPYAYQRRSIDTWVRALGELLTQDIHTRLYKPRFSLNPF